ncbi:TPA: fimbrial chaperone [Salmonella enterica subsp. salamae serovar 28:r:e,n,z15]|nr:fimbrial chaperone [Salmonella enterica subsp. salamae serovar 28:r:e,n,z15]
MSLINTTYVRQKKALAGIILSGMLFSTQALAAFTLNGTRFIYDEEQKNISFEVTNHTGKTYGGQVWIDNESLPEDSTTMVPSPTFFKVGEHQKQIIRILNINDSDLPKDKESLFRLNVQEIPPAPGADKSALTLAMSTQVKLIYRPSALKKGRPGAEKNLRIIQRNGQSVLQNPTAYYFAVLAIHNGRDENAPVVQLDKDVISAISTLPPGAEVPLHKKLQAAVTLDAIDDYGGSRSYTITP